MFLRTLEFLSLSLWLGSDVFVSLILAPGAFRLLASRDQAGAIVGFSLSRMHGLGIVCGLVLLAARLLRMRALATLAGPSRVSLRAGKSILTVQDFDLSI